MMPTAQICTTNQGIKYLLFDTNDLISNHIKHFGVFDETILNIANVALTHLKKTKNSGIILDIGANIGTFTLPLAKIFSEFNFEAFEVQSTVFYQLCANIILNSLENVTAHNFGLSENNESFMKNSPDYNKERNIGMYSLVNEYNNLLRGEETGFSTKTVNIECRKLDSLQYGNDIILIKIDVEGMELSVLKGAAGTIVNNNFPPIFYEAWHHPWFIEKRMAVDDYLKNIGYQITYFGDNAYAQHPKNGFYLVFE